MLAQEGLGSPDQASLLGDPNRQKPASIPATGATGFHLYENQHISFVGNQIQLAPRAAPPLGQDLPALLTEILPHPALADVACILEGSPSGQGIHKKNHQRPALMSRAIAVILVGVVKAVAGAEVETCQREDKSNPHQD
jgi:hypothetical protein